MLKIKHIFLLWFVLLPFVQWSQTEPELKEAAENLFKKEQYVEATSLYLRLLSLQPKDFDYNYKYGTCLLFNSNKKQDAIRYLAYAVKGPGISPDAFYFLAKAYHLNFQFTEAMANYKSYQTKAGAKGIYYLGAERNIQMCLNGQQLLSSITEIVVKKKTEIANAEFFRIYDLTNIGGSIIVGKDFQTKNDKKANHMPIVHFPDGASKIFFSSYGDGNQKDIFYVERTGGAFSDPVKISGDVNTEFDEDYPYLHPNGEYLYFSSKGHNSMGGYDVFRARYDAGANRFGNVENVDFAISSPDDDILYMVDKNDQYAFFASARQSQNGKIYVYEVLVDRVPVQMAILKGSFESLADASNKTMIVDVYDKNSGAKVGRFRTNEKGEYIITFPKGGKYEYRASVECSNEKFTAQVEIPYLKNFKPLKQKAVHEAVGDGEVLKVINLFDEEVDDAQSLLAEILKQKSDLDVNINNYNLNELLTSKEKSPVLAELGLSKMTTFEASQMFDQKSNEFKNAGGDGGQSGANALVVNSVEEIQLMDNEINELLAEAKSAKSDEVKYSLLNQAKELAETRENKLADIANIEKTLTKVKGGGISKENQDSFIEVSKQVKDLVNAGKEDEALEVIATNRAVLKNVLNASGTANTDELAQKEQKLTSDLQKLDQSVENYTREIDVVESEIATLEKQKSTAAEKNKATIQSDIDVKVEQLAELKGERLTVQKSQKAKANERSAVSSELEAIMALTNYKGPNVTKEQAETAKANLKNEQAKSLKNSIDQDLASLVASNPSLEGTGTLTVAQRIMSEYEKKASSIKNNSSLSDKARDEQLLALDRETKEQLQERLADLKNELAGDRFNEQLKSELAQIETYNSDLDASIAALESGSSVATTNTSGTNNTNDTNSNNGNSSTTDIASITNESVSKSVDSDYQSKKNAITSGGGSPEEKLIETQRLDEAFLNNSRKKLAETEQAIKNNPTDQGLKKQKEILSDLIDQKIDEIDEREAELAQLASAGNDIASTNTNSTNGSDNSTNSGTNGSNGNNSDNGSNTNGGTNTNSTNGSSDNLPGVSDETRKQVIETVDEYYEIEMSALKQSTSPNKDEKIVEREQRLQSSIGKRISAIDDLIASGSTDSGLKNELAILKSEMTRSQDRVKAIEGGSDIASTTTNDTNNSIEPTNANSIEVDNAAKNLSRTEIIKEVDNTYLTEIAALERSTSEDKFAKLADRELEFQSSLGRKIATKSDELLEDESNVFVQAELKVLKEELAKSRTRSNDYEQKADAASSVAGTNNFDSEQYIDEIRSDILSANAAEVESTYSTKPELERQEDVLRAYESELVNIIKSKKQASNIGTDPKLIAQLKSVEDELTKVQKKRREISVTLGEIEQLALSNNEISDNTELKTEIEKNNNQLSNLLAEGNFDSNEASFHEAKKKEIDELLTYAEAAKNDESKNKLYNIAKKAQTDLVKSMTESRIENREIELAKSAEIDEISTTEELEKLKRRYSIEVGELTQSIISAKSPANGSPDPTKIQMLEQEKAITQSKLDRVEARLAKLKESLPVIVEAAKNQVVPTQVETEIVSSPEYEAYVNAAKEASETEEELKKLTISLNEEKSALKQLIEDEVKNGTNRTAEIEERTNRIRRFSVTLGDLQRQYESRRQIAISKLPVNENRRLYYQNLYYRGIPPRPELASTTSNSRGNVVPTNTSNPTNVGIDINPNRTTPTSIEIGVNNQTGLVYRVQIGAFSKPIPQDLFKEFTPVSGEKVGSTNITRYMAGAFGDNKKVIEARDQIRRLGYADAFAVAYCDGKRISFAEAIALQNSGGCVGSNANSLTVNETSPTNNVGSTPTIDVSYNEAPGAAKATAIELKTGLFFTVQIGVFNKPAQHSQLFYLDPLMTLKLKNNQIRYSCGMFKSLADAKVKLAEVKSKGIADAFVTVYYKGERIGLQEGIKLLESQGATVLEKTIN